LYAIISKQSKNHVSDLSEAIPLRANFLTSASFAKRMWTKEVAFASRTSWRKITSLAEVTAVNTTDVHHERKKSLLCIL